MEASSPPGGEASRRPALEALSRLRFVAAIGVVLYHGTSRWWAPGYAPLGHLVGNGFVGVSLFFVLSGFILA